MIRTVLSLAALLAAAVAGAQTPAYAPPPPPAPAAPPPSTLPAAASSPSPGAPAASGEPVKAAEGTKPALPRGAVLEEVAGTVADVDRKAHKLAIETPTGMVTLALDRNTMVYTAGGLGTVHDLKLGSHIRAGRNADFLAYWVQVRGAPAMTPPTPGQGTGPAGGAGAGESTGPGAGPTPSPPTGGGPGSTTAPGGAPPGP